MDATEGAVVVGGLAALAYVAWKVWKKSPADGPKPPAPGTSLKADYWLPSIPGLDPIVRVEKAIYDSTLSHLSYGAPTPAVGADGKLCPCGVDSKNQCVPCGSDVGYKVYGAIGDGAKTVWHALTPW